MLPTRLTLRNFLPYRAPDPVLFAGLHLAVLSGPNGSGKSSLLDAITWALWGRARAKTDQELISLGAEEMSVELDFEQEGEEYRVVRQRNRKRRQGTLNLFIYDEKVTGGFNDISASTMRETQARINDLLRLDYETFVHSAFLQQGKADAFTVRTPARRKQILADILGLDAWGVYEQRTRRQIREYDTALDNIDGRLTEIAEDLAREPALKRDLTAAEAAYTEAENALKTAEAHYDKIKDAPAQLRAATDRLHDLARRLKEYNDDEQSVERELARQGERIASYEAIINQREAIEAGFATLESARQTDQSLSDKLLNLQSAENHRHELEGQIALAKASLKAEASDHRGAIDELERLTGDTSDLVAELAAVEAELGRLGEKEAEREDLRKSSAGLTEEAATLKTTNAALRTEMATIKTRMDTLQTASPDDVLCPTCQQPLSPQQRDTLLSDYHTQGTTLGDQFRANRARLDELSATIAAQETLNQALLQELSQLNGLRQRVGELRAKQATARDAESRLTEARAALSSVESALEHDNYAGEARAQLAALQDEIATLGYDRSAHTAARENLSAYQTYEARHHDLQIALDSLPEAQTALAATQNRGERLRRIQAEDNSAHADLTGEVERLKALVQEANRRFDEANQRRTEAQIAGEKRARVQQALHALQTARQRQITLGKRRAQLEEQRGITHQLRDAFGKNGIPAMIIETIIPELEDTANELLARMTDGQMQLQFAMQRETVSGKTAETLDIIIADEVGTRDYALYSGGEAFRINFAIRIALSKLLARRAGAHLRTLFVDEGFGTQDAIGRERLIEAINAVSDDFDLILVITHIDDLRDTFPARLEVEKTPSGSQIRMG